MNFLDSIMSEKVYQNSSGNALCFIKIICSIAARILGKIHERGVYYQKSRKLFHEISLICEYIVS